jgi:RNA polymerase sigma-70 factor (ECF subfamily)
LKASARKFTKIAADADDVVQGVMERLIKVGSTAGVGDEVRFIRRTVHNAGVDVLRRTPAADMEVSVDSEDAVELVDPRPTPYEQVAADEERQQLLESLPPRCREVFRLVKLEGYSYDEAAIQLKITKETVKSHLKTAVPLVARFYSPRSK